MEDAEEVMSKMRRRRIPANVVTYNTLLKGYAQTGNLQVSLAHVQAGLLCVFVLFLFAQHGGDRLLLCLAITAKPLLVTAVKSLCGLGLRGTHNAVFYMAATNHGYLLSA